MPVKLIEAAELKSLLESASNNISVLYARRRDEYQKGHIPHAVSVAWEDWCAKAPDHLTGEMQEPGYWGLLADFDQKTIEQKLSGLGLSDDQPIVVYANSAKSKGREGRIAWMLLYYGAKDVRVLNGGIDAWTFGLTTDSPTSRYGAFQVKFDHARRIALHALKSQLQENKLPILIDTRTRKEFEGECYDYMPRKGTLPNSSLLAYDWIFQADGKFISPDRLRDLVPLEVREGQNAVALCEVGVRASMVALLYEIYFGRIMPVYDGSIMEWAAEKDLPMKNAT